MNQYTEDGFRDVCNARAHLYELTVFFETLTNDENLPSSLRSASENALSELLDRYADLDMYMRYLCQLDPDLYPRQYKEF